ncbi:nucleotidyltransferase domain-containing protein [Streptomyces sp. NPDC057654]|uniref:nucleotidyltransferase domain-containing protein n=1 Tax=Streptomyces sp. NPDC057654 TaxID=3346196 RepID=UPI003684E437
MTGTDTPWGRWEPAPLPEVAALFSGLAADPMRSGRGAPWWIAGGYAIELAVGRAFRDHGDIDVLLLRRDQLAAQRALPGWEWWAADPPGTLRPWREGEMLPDHVHDIWCRPGPAEPWRIQVMLDESEDGGGSQGDAVEWVSRRDSGVRRPVRTLGALSAESVPYLAPEVQLYYKAKDPRPKDERDFAAALPALSPAARRWLVAAMDRTYGRHPWSQRLAAAPVE